MPMREQELQHLRMMEELESDGEKGTTAEYQALEAEALAERTSRGWSLTSLGQLRLRNLRSQAQKEIESRVAGSIEPDTD